MEWRDEDEIWNEHIKSRSCHGNGLFFSLGDIYEYMYSNTLAS